MSTEHLVAFFMSRRKCDFKKAVWLAEQTIVKRKLAAEKKTAHLQSAQLTMGFDEMPKEEATHAQEPDEDLGF